ncbi:MAG: hypothetical protein ACI3XM_11965 [Eubacteriales bacterium]
MKKHIFTAVLVCVLTAVVSCGDTGSSSVQTNADNSPEETTAVQENTKAIDSIGPLSDLDFGGAELCIDISVNSEEWNTSSVYIMGADEEIGDTAKDLVYRRNIEITDALNLQIEWVQTDLGYESVYNYIQKPVLAGDSIADLYINDQYGLVRCLTAGCLYNIADMNPELSYFDFSTDGWYTEYMDDLSVLSGRRYFLVGDYFMDVLRASHVIFFNKNLFSTLYEGADELYDLVLDGNWTYDTFIDYIKDCYQDLNGNGSVDSQDLFGFRAHPAWTSLYFGTTDCHTVSRDKDGNLTIDPSIDRLSVLADKLIEIYSNPGFCILKDNEHTDARIDYFVNGQMLFTGWLKLADLENEKMRNMDGIGLIPYPKIDETQETYRTLVHDIVEIGAVPITIDEKNLSMLSAYLQAMTQYTEHHIMPAYFETALKIKYSQDEQSRNMLDLIRDGITSPFEYAYKAYFSAVGSDPLNKSIVQNTNVVASSVEKGTKTAEKQLEKFMDALNALS